MMEQIQPIKDSHRYREWVTFAKAMCRPSRKIAVLQ